MQERDSNGLLRDLDTTGSSVKLGIGGIDDAPTSGAFKLTINGVTSNAITYSTDEATVAGYIYTAVSNNVATVTTYGNEPDAYILTATQPNTAMSFGGSAFTLFPTSSVLVGTRRFPASSIAAQQVIRLVRNPAVYSDTFVASATAGVVSLTKIQDGSSTKNETYDLAIGSDAEGGSVVLNYGANSTTAVPIGSTAVCFQEALTSITEIGAGNISVDIGNNAGNYSISFVRNLGLTNITTALTIDASGVIFGNFLQTTVTMATAELDELFAETGADTITPKIEVELTQGGTPKTVLQTDVAVRRDLITTGSAVPAAQASYYTKSETNSLFVRNSTTGIDAISKVLYDDYSYYSVDWGSRALYDINSVPALYWNTGVQVDANIGFYGNAPTAKPTGTNIVSGLTNLGLLSYTQPTATNVVTSLINTGLIANGATYGVLPSSPRTLTTTASIYFGAVGGNSTNSVSVVVTGCQVNDIVLLGLPASNPQGISFNGHVTTTNGLEVDCINATNGSLTPATATYRITVIGY